MTPASLDTTLLALADPSRRGVIDLLRRKPRRAGELAEELGLTAPAMSRHLRVLRSSGLVERAFDDDDARANVYRLRPEKLMQLRSWLDDIERFRQRTGRYPIAIQSLVPDYHPDVIGIERYRYEPSGESFNLYFEMPSADLATSLIVMYNPRGEQDFSSHAFDLLQLSPEDIRRQRGYFASETLPQRGWKMFLFD